MPDRVGRFPHDRNAATHTSCDRTGNRPKALVIYECSPPANWRGISTFLEVAPKHAAFQNARVPSSPSLLGLNGRPGPADCYRQNNRHSLTGCILSAPRFSSRLASGEWRVASGEWRVASGNLRFRRLFLSPRRTTCPVICADSLESPSPQLVSFCTTLVWDC
jgi:hypothetical protein